MCTQMNRRVVSWSARNLTDRELLNRPFMTCRAIMTRAGHEAPCPLPLADPALDVPAARPAATIGTAVDFLRLRTGWRAEHSIGV